MRFRDMDRIDMGTVREKVRAWMTAHPGGTPGQMTADLKDEYGEFAEDMTIVLRGFMARFQDHPEDLTSPGPAVWHAGAGDSGPGQGGGTMNRT